MEIKNLLNKIHHHQPSIKSFLALYLNDDVLQLAVWQIIDHQPPQIVSSSQLIRWDGSTDSNLIEVVDQALSQALQSLDLSSDPNQIIFGLPFAWLDSQTGDILPEKKQLLKSLSQQLELKPLGFVLSAESLILYLKQQEGNPLNAFLVQVDDLNLTLSLIKQNRFLHTKTTARTDDFLTDFLNLLNQLVKDYTEPLPSRILLFDGHHDLQEFSQLLNSQDWQTNFSFLHLPQVEILPPDIGVKSLALAGGAEIAQSLGLLTETPQPFSPQESQKISPPQQSQLEELGFALDQDLPSPPVEPTEKPPKQPLLSRFKPKLPQFHLSLSLPHFSLSSSLLFFILPFIFLFILIFAGIWFLPQAKLTLYLKPKSIQTNLNLTLDPQLQTIDFSRQAIPAVSFDQTLKGEKTLATTGTGIVGEKAKGKVTIYNRTSLTKTFPAGTVLTANNLRFTLASSVTVASKSTDANYTDIPGKADVDIVATKIGDKYNLPADTEFKVANYSTESYVARNSSALSGGSSQEVKVVSQKDYDQLYDQLVQELQQQFKDTLDQTNSEQAVIFDQANFKTKHKQYSAKIGQKADQLSLNLELDFKGLKYNKADVLSLVNHQLKDSLPLGFHQLKDSLQLQIKSQQLDESGSAQLNLVAQLSLLPDLDNSKLAILIKGKTPAQASQLLHSLISEFVQAKLEFKPTWWPASLRRLPFNPQRLSLSIQPL